MKAKELREKIYSSFADLATSLGYSDVLGRVIACLLTHDFPVPLSRVAQETGYSSSMVSLSVDFLESVGMVRKIKKPGDRKLYLKADGNLLDAVKKIILARIERKVSTTLKEFEDYKKELRKLKDEESKRLLNAINILEKEIRKTSRYVKILSKVKLP